MFAWLPSWCEGSTNHVDTECFSFEGMQRRYADDEDQANRVTEQVKLHKTGQVQTFAMQVTKSVRRVRMQVRRQVTA